MADNTTEKAVATTQETEPTQGKEGRTFSQTELDSIVKSRVYEEQKKFSDYKELKKKAERLDEIEEASKTELQKATEKAEKLEAELNTMKRDSEIRAIRARVSESCGVPVDLLTAETEEACMEQATALLAWKDPGYPSLRDAGESTVTLKKSAADDFAEWMKKTMNH